MFDDRAKQRELARQAEQGAQKAEAQAREEKRLREDAEERAMKAEARAMKVQAERSCASPTNSPAKKKSRK